jgi:alpha-L-fucosidase 2
LAEGAAAAFRTLRAVGAFLVSAACSGGQVEQVEILSEAGATLRLLMPWKEGARLVSSSGERNVEGEVLELATSSGETVRLLPPKIVARNQR